MVTKSIYLNDERKRICDANFRTNAFGKGGFSEWIGQKLDELEPSNSNLDALEKKKEDLTKESNILNEKIEELNDKIQLLIQKREGKNVTTSIEF